MCLWILDWRERKFWQFKKFTENRANYYFFFSNKYSKQCKNLFKTETFLGLGCTLIKTCTWFSFLTLPGQFNTELILNTEKFDFDHFGKTQMLSEKAMRSLHKYPLAGKLN